MSGNDLNAEVVLRLIDQMTAPARQAGASARALRKDLDALGKFKMHAGLGKQFADMTKGAREAASGVSKLRTEISRPVKSGFSRADIGLEKIRRDAREATSSIRGLRRAMSDGGNFRGDIAPRSRGRRGSRSEPSEGRRALVGIGGVYAAQGGAEFARKTLETYREFDKERRFGAAVMGISFEDQKDLIRQAIHMGGSSKYNDISVLEGQRELAARGLKKEAILGMMPSAANLGMSLDMPLGDSVKQLDAAIFGFKKDISSVAAATRSAQETADAQVKAAKISGMSPSDIQAVYRYGATPAHMAGVSENNLLTFGGVLKRANIGGDMAGTAFRALISASEAPTRGAKEALLANGMDFSKYQPKIGALPLDPFVKNVAAQYGLKLNKGAQTALSKVFANPALLNDQSKFAPAVVDALKHTLGKKDLKSMKSISGMANRFRNSVGGGTDVNSFLTDLMLKLPGNLKLANALFGAKQGARIATALGDPEVVKMLKEQLDNAKGYSKKIADERMAGFDGAVSRFEGAVKNLETAFGRSLDNNGKGGVLTDITSGVAHFTQSLAEAPPAIQRMIIGVTAAGAAFAGVKGAKTLLDGFGLRGSAVALTEAAAALRGAAMARNPLPGGGKLGTAAKEAKHSIPTFGGRGLFMGFNLWDVASNWDSHLNHDANGGMSIKRNADVEKFNGWWDKTMPWWLRSDASQNMLWSVKPPTDFGIPQSGKMTGLRPAAKTLAVSKAAISPITDAVDNVAPTFMKSGADAMGSFASGMASGAGAASAQMTSVLASLTTIASSGIRIPVMIDDADANAKLNALLSKAGSVGAGVGKGKAYHPQFSNGLHDKGG